VITVEKTFIDCQKR